MEIYLSDNQVSSWNTPKKITILVRGPLQIYKGEWELIARGGNFRERRPSSINDDVLWRESIV